MGRILVLSQFEVLEAQCYAGATVFEVFSDSLVMFGDQFEVFRQKPRPQRAPGIHRGIINIYIPD